MLKAVFLYTCIYIFDHKFFNNDNLFKNETNTLSLNLDIKSNFFSLVIEMVPENEYSEMWDVSFCWSAGFYSMSEA